MKDDYRGFVKSKIIYKSPEMDMLHAAIGLCEEAGEVAGVIKKHILFGQPFNRDKLLNELGDVRFNLEFILSLIDATMNEVEAGNIDKLNKRYPNGFNTLDSIKRMDE